MPDESVADPADIRRAGGDSIEKFADIRLTDNESAGDFANIRGVLDDAVAHMA